MSRLNTMYQDDEFLKNISDMMGKLDNKNETEIKQEIEQIGYKEFYRYYKEKDVYIKQLQQENKILRENAENNDKVVDKVNWENMLLKKENQQLKIQISAREEVCNRLESNWNKLKEYCKENTLCYEVGDDENTKLIGSKIHGLNVLNKMQEMEKNYGNF